MRPLIVSILGVVLLLGGCASLFQPKVDADQLKAIAADKNAGVTCTTVNGVYGSIKYSTVNLDKSVIPNGSVTHDGEKCVTTITTHQFEKEPKDGK